MSIFKKLKMLFKGRKVLKEVMKQKGQVQKAFEKSSWKSSEFWFAVLTGLGAIAAQAGGLIPPPYGPAILASSGALYALSRGIAKHSDPLGGLKANISTTEFWVNILSNAGAITAAFSQTVAPETAAFLMMASNGAYAISRGIAKGGAQPTK